MTAEECVLAGPVQVTGLKEPSTGKADTLFLRRQLGKNSQRFTQRPGRASSEAPTRPLWLFTVRGVTGSLHRGSRTDGEEPVVSTLASLDVQISLSKGSHWAICVPSEVGPAMPAPPGQHVLRGPASSGRLSILPHLGSHHTSTRATPACLLPWSSQNRTHSPSLDRDQATKHRCEAHSEQ